MHLPVSDAAKILLWYTPEDETKGRFFTAEIAESAEPWPISPSVGEARKKKRADSE